MRTWQRCEANLDLNGGFNAVTPTSVCLKKMASLTKSTAPVHWCISLKGPLGWKKKENLSYTGGIRGKEGVQKASVIASGERCRLSLVSITYP